MTWQKKWLGLVQVLNQVLKLEDNRELVQDQTLKHSDSRELKCISNMLVKNMETISVE